MTTLFVAFGFLIPIVLVFVATYAILVWTERPTKSATKARVEREQFEVGLTVLARMPFRIRPAGTPIRLRNKYVSRGRDE